MSRLSDFSRASEFPFRFQVGSIFSLGLALSLAFATIPLVVMAVYLLIARRLGAFEAM